MDFAFKRFIQYLSDAFRLKIEKQKQVMSRYFMLLCFLTVSLSIVAQTEEEKSSKQGEVTNTTLNEPPDLLMEEEKEEEEAAPKKIKKNFYFGEKTKKGYTKNFSNGKEVLLLFNFVKDEHPIDPYVRDIYWMDFKEGEVKISRDIQPWGRLLHGPYQLIIDDVVIEEGMFYYGTKHGRWMTYNANDILVDKTIYYRGWPRGSEISYYAGNKMKELIPIEYGEKEGNYFYFYENGQIAVSGMYEFGEKIGVWTEYYRSSSGRLFRKKQIQYQEEAFTRGFKPYVLLEWDSDGRIIYDATKKSNQ